mgnify:CR=1 FL=1
MRLLAPFAGRGLAASASAVLLSMTFQPAEAGGRRHFVETFAYVVDAPAYPDLGYGAAVLPGAMYGDTGPTMYTAYATSYYAPQAFAPPYAAAPRRGWKARHRHHAACGHRRMAVRR